MDSRHGASAPISTRCECVVDLAAISSNLRVMRKAAGKADLLCVVKADAYGHGATVVARALRAEGVAWLGVALPAEALALRAAGDQGRMLTWLWSPGDEPAVRACLEQDVDLSVSGMWSLEQIVRAASAAGKTPARIHVKVDTGLSRNGVPMKGWADIMQAVKRAEQANLVQVVGIWSHLASADEPNSTMTDAQAAVFASALEEAKVHGVVPQLRHICNSAATLTRPDLHYDLCRTGVAIYGLSPSVDMGTAASLGLRPAMTLRAALANVKTIAPGTKVGYGGTWSATKATLVGPSISNSYKTPFFVFFKWRRIWI